MPSPTQLAAADRTGDKPATRQRPPSGRTAGDPDGARRHEFDWVRGALIVSVVWYHAAQVFTGDRWGLRGVGTSAALAEFCFFLHQWRMPLLFCLSGAATWTTLARRSPRQFARDRVRRLLVPLGFGVVALLPPQLYHAGQVGGSFVEFYPRFLDAMLADRAVQWGHLWFIAYLLLADLLAVPAMVWLRSRRGRPWVVRAERLLARPDAALALVLPVTVAYCLPARLVEGWTVFHVAPVKDFVFWLTLYACGFVFAAGARATQAMVARRGAALRLAVLAQAAVYAARWATAAADASANDFRLLDFTVGVTAWLWVVAVLSYAAAHLRFENAALRYLREASYPVYLLHQTLLLYVALFIARWPAPLGVRFVGIAAVTLVATLGLYELVIRRTTVGRFLFGLRPHPRPARAPAAAWGARLVRRDGRPEERRVA